MSSFFTIPGAQKKRKRPIAPDVPKKRLAGAQVNGKSTPRAVAAPQKQKNKKQPSKKKQAEADESISSSEIESEDEDDNEVSSAASAFEEDEESEKERETAGEARLRLAERYLENVQQEIDATGFDAADLDRDLIAERLQEDVAELKGKVYRNIALELDLTKSSSCQFKSNTHSVTAIAACKPYVYTTTKDMHLHKWRIQELPQNQWPQTTRKKPKKPPAPPKKRPELVTFLAGWRKDPKNKDYLRHVGPILCVAVSSDGKFLATGGADRRLIIYDAEALKPLKVFTHHRDAVTGLAFRRGTHQLYSCSKDRTVKVWSLDEMAYVETLFGHQDDIVDIDALAQERCVSVGSRDRTARLWKVVEESQLVFRGGGAVDKKSRPDVHPESLTHEGSMDRVAMLDDELFVTGSDNGALALWSLSKKKPVFVLAVAHGLNPALTPAQYTSESDPSPRAVPCPTPRSITALTTIPYSDLILSGSWDGAVRLWRLSNDKKKIEPVGALGRTTTPQAEEEASSEAVAAPIKGVINDIAVFERGDKGADGLCVVAAVGKEHRFGRWNLVKGGKNGAVVFELPRSGAKAMPNGTHEAEQEQEQMEGGSA